MNYEKVLEKPVLNENLILVKASEKEDILGLIRYFQEKGYTYEDAHRIMEWADSTMQRVVQMRKI